MIPILNLKRNKNKEFIIGKNLSNASNKIAKMRFAQTSSKWSNPHFLLYLQFTKSGLKCIDECRPSPLNPDEDVCTVYVGSSLVTQPCVQITNVNTMRKMLAEERIKSIDIFTSIIGEINALLAQFPALVSQHDNLMAKRKEYYQRWAEILLQKEFLKQIIQILTSNADKIDQLNDAISKLKKLLEKMMKKYETPDADCSGLSGYEKELEGDGIKAKQYNNLDWKGQSIDKVDNRIKMFWHNESPAPGIDPNNFTVEWSGYLRPPKTDEQFLECDSDDACLVTINGSVVINDGISEGSDDLLADKRTQLNEQIKAGKWDEFIKPPTLDSPPKFPRNKRTPNPIPLIGGEYVKITVKIIHSVHNTLFEDGNAFVQLYWESKEIRKEVIPAPQFYTKLEEKFFKPTDYNSKIYVLDELQENDNAFIDVDAYKIRFIPPEYRGLFILKTISDYKQDKVEFSSSMAVRVFFAYDKSKLPPIDTKWKKSNYEMALLKIESEDINKLKNGETVVSTDDVSLNIYYRDFLAGKIDFNLMIVNPMKILLFMSPGLKPPNFSCGGAEIQLSKDPLQFATCAQTSFQGDNDCNAGLNKGFWVASKNVDETILLSFKSKVKPTKIIIQQPEELTNMAKKIEVKMNDDNIEQLDCIQIKGQQEFKLLNPIAINSLEVTVKNIYGGSNASIGLEVYGIGCVDLDQTQYKQELKQKELFGLKTELPESLKTCDDTMDTLTGQEAKVKCVESCEVKTELVTEIIPGIYTLDSNPCIAAKMQYKGKPEANEKVFGIKKISNDTVLPSGQKPPYAFVFDKTIAIPPINFKTNEEVDVLDDKQCFIRGVLNSIEGVSANVKSSGRDLSVTTNKLFKCGSKLPFVECKNPSTTLITFKFLPNNLIDVFKNNNISYNFDSGQLIKTYESYTQGWDKEIKMVSMKNLINSKDRNELINGTAVQIDSDNIWTFNVPNITFDVKIQCKQIENDENLLKFKDKKLQMHFKLNNEDYKSGELKLSDEIIQEAQNLKITDGKIKLQRVIDPDMQEMLNVVSITHIDFKPIDKSANMKNGRNVVGPNTQEGSDCIENPTDCVFDATIINNIKCPGVFVKVSGQTQFIDMACKYKCIQGTFDGKDDCQKACPDGNTCKMGKGGQICS